VSFSGNLKDNAIKLSWTVDLNETADKFEVERSINNKFSTIGTVNALPVSGTSSYSFVDPLSSNEKVSYRLRMTDKNQKTEYSKILAFNISANADVSINLLQNPVNDKLNLNFQVKEREVVNVRVIDMTGSVRTSQKMNVQSGTNLLFVSLPPSMSTGSYVVSIQHSKGMYTQKFLKR
jgi:hypothetical protein